MSASFIICAAVLATGVDTGWQPAPDGGLEYIIQIEPELIDALREGQVVTSEIPYELKDVRRYRIQIGTAQVPRSTQTTAARPSDPPALDTRDPLSAAATETAPLPASRPLEPPAPLRSIVPPADEPAVEGPTKRVIRSEPTDGTADERAVEGSTYERTASTAAGPLVPLAGRAVPKPKTLVETTAPAADPRPSLPADANPPAAKEEEEYPQSPAGPSLPASNEPAVVMPMESEDSPSSRDATGTKPADKPRIGLPPTSGSRIIVEPFIRKVPGETKASSAAPAAGEATSPAVESSNDAAANERDPADAAATKTGSAKLGESPLPQNPIKDVARDDAPPAAPAAAPAAASATAPAEAASEGPSFGANAPPTAPATIGATPPANATPPASIEPTPPADANAVAGPANDAGLVIPPTPAAETNTRDWLGLGARSAAKTPASEPETAPAEAGLLQTTPEPFERSPSQPEPAPAASSDATASGAANLVGGPGVKVGAWTIPAGVLVAAFVASLGGNLFLAWVAWGMQSKFARLAERYQISQWKSPPTP